MPHSRRTVTIVKHEEHRSTSIQHEGPNLPQLHGVRDGHLHLTEDVKHHGMTNGDVIVEPGVTVVLHGIVNGSVINHGGHLTIYGIVNGQIIRLAGTTIIKNPLLQ